MKRLLCRIFGHRYPKERPNWIEGNYVWQCRRCLRVVHGRVNSRWQ